MRLFYLLCLLLLMGNVVLAQQYNFRTWTLADGLPQSKINDILQDHKRQIWVATRGGVSRFDGQTFHTYNKQQGLASNNTSCLFLDSRNRLWIGSTDNGLTRFNGTGFTIYNTLNGLPPGGIAGITEDKMGHLLVATNAGIFRQYGDRFTRLTAFPEEAYHVVYSDAAGVTWAGSKTNGLYKLEQEKLQQYTAAKNRLPSNEVTALFSESATGKLWIGTSAGPVSLSKGQFIPVELPASVLHPAVSDFATDGYGNILISFRQDGLLSVGKDKPSHLTKTNGLSSNKITAMLLDREQNLWVGTDGYGLQQKRAQWFLHYFDLGRIKDPKVTALAQDSKGRVWFGTDNGDAAYMEGSQLNMLEANLWPPATTLNSMWVKSEEDVWVGTSAGVWNLTPARAHQYTTTQGLPANETNFILTDAQGRIWAATAGGVAFLHNNTFVPVHTVNGQATGKAYHLYRDRRNRLWAGTDAGIFLVKNDRLHPVPHLAKQNFGEVTSIAGDAAGWLYFGGYNYGILAYHPETGRIKKFTAKDGLTDEGIKTLYLDRSQNLWAGTNRNVLKIDIPYFRQTQKLRFRTYNGHNGFRGLEVAHNGITQTPDGKVWFGTTRGLTQYSPELDRINKASPKLLLTDIKLFMHPTNWKQLGFKTDDSGLPVNLRLPHNKNHITFNFLGICLTAPSQVRYKYKLTGYDQQWSETSDQSFATYASLEPGTYTFMLKAQNNDGYWTSQPLTYTFSVIPPLWRREWFVGMLLLLLAGTIIGVIRFREKSLVKMNSLLDMRVKHRTRMLERKHREKELLLQEVHHRVKNNLQIVISLLNLQARHVKDPEAVEVMHAIRSRVRSMALLHERLYRHDNLEQIDLEDYFREICDSLYAAYGISEEKVSLHLEIPPTMVDLDSAITLGLIVNELVSNALKYAFPGSATGKLGITLSRPDADHYQLIVCDNGVGTPEAVSPQQSFGLQLVSSLSKKLSGSISICHNNGTKATLFFVIPS